jgi:hypothetical protein
LDLESWNVWPSLPAKLAPREYPRPVSLREGDGINEPLERLSIGMNSRLEWDGDVTVVTAAEPWPNG